MSMYNIIVQITWRAQLILHAFSILMAFGNKYWLYMSGVSSCVCILLRSSVWNEQFHTISLTDVHQAKAKAAHSSDDDNTDYWLVLYVLFLSTALTICWKQNVLCVHVKLFLWVMVKSCASETQRRPSTGFVNRRADSFTKAKQAEILLITVPGSVGRHGGWKRNRSHSSSPLCEFSSTSLWWIGCHFSTQPDKESRY